MMPHTGVEVFALAVTRPNPGRSAAAWGIEVDGLLTATGTRVLDPQTNNSAAYTAVVLALVEASQRGYRDFVLSTDSQLVTKQLTGEWGGREEHLLRMRDEILRALKRLGHVQIRWRPVRGLADLSQAAWLAHGDPPWERSA
jgi:ribonuclease HI